jgi:hypothetical protein
MPYWFYKTGSYWQATTSKLYSPFPTGVLRKGKGHYWPIVPW